MTILFVEPSLRDNQREFAGAFVSIGAAVYGIGERPEDWLDPETRGRLRAYRQIASVTDDGALE